MCFKFVYLFVLLCAVDILVDGLKMSDTGVCVVPISVQKSRNGRMFTVKYKCGNKICTAKRYKRVMYRQTQNRTVCCKGWKYDGDFDVCSAICSKGCAGGNCIAPETCQCPPPSILDQDNGNACHLPLCKPQCYNGRCIANNTCQCFEGFENFNGTCKPKCDSCANGKCVAPNECQCSEGYIKNNGSCTAVCKGCDNGVCTSPEVCRCIDGYLRDEESQICYRPCNGTCSTGVCGYGNDEIICCAGYNWALSETGEVCKPICRRSCGLHGTCVKPDECKCNAPYIAIENTCILPPTCDNPCYNGKCTGNNTCTCNSGYTRINETACEPVCKPTCKNAICTDPDKCVCLRGFKRKNQWECVPECDECDNGECIATNVCNCSTGYVKEGKKCVPHCNSDCKHGRCSKPNECTCDPGYEVDPLTRLICNPVCETKCINATCTGPNQCACFPGYTRHNTSVCKPKCDYCTNGECVGPNECRCHIGYKMTGMKCKPVCAQECIHGFCSEPDKCTCRDGYLPDGSNKYVCQPHCAECVNASCIAPDTCECLEGFERRNDSDICTPICQGCENGQCTSPGVCSCNDGYIKSNGTCEPVCLPACVNGYCQAPNECACFEGYKMNSMDFSVCYKPCICFNGVCSDNGTCICNPGYVFDGDSCESNETIDCQSCHGTCEESECSCSDGRPCYGNLDQKALKTGLAGLELTWILGACVASLLIVLVLAIMVQMWRRRPDYVKTANTEGNTIGSVVFAAPGTLRNRVLDSRVEEYDDVDEEIDEYKQRAETLLPHDIRFENERL